MPFWKRRDTTTAPDSAVDSSPTAVKTPVVETPPTVVASEALQLVEERVDVSKLQVPGDTVRVSTHTEEIEDTVEMDLRRENYDVVRVTVDQVVDSVPEIRREDGVTIIPVMEERLVVTKQLVLREELHIREDHQVVTHTEPVVLRKQHATVERESAD